MSLLTPGPRPTLGPWGVDLHSGRILSGEQWDWLQANGCKFAWLRVDDAMSRLAKEASKRGIEVGVYAFLHPGSGKDQALHLLAELRRTQTPLGPHGLIAADIEDTTTVGGHRWTAAENPAGVVTDFLDTVKRETSIVGFQYTYRSFFKKHNLRVLSQMYKLWAADYNRDKSWEQLDAFDKNGFGAHVDVWQFGGGPIPPNHVVGVDKNLWRGDW